ncbi:unnamed protein product [Ambrosiozyma monospora]|uniref:Unnamed protein product n=1 Tax=Ambrosiozyma monospora TaxID=43982 RepID=A0ACB5TK53_AMBMO|nr:unnamed protein product [Ambrosiozyma monospora]
MVQFVTGLAVIAKLPDSLADARYTLINQYGEIEFVSRHQTGVRIPNVFPKGWFEHSILEESQFVDPESGLASIGKPYYKLEDKIGKDKLFDSAMSKATVNLGASKVKTYIVPSFLAEIISKELTGIINEAWDILPMMNLKLEVLHNILQCNESPIVLSFRQLYEAAKITNLEELAKGLTSKKEDMINKTYEKLLLKLQKAVSVSNQFNSVTLGKPIVGSVERSYKTTIQEYYAFIMSVRKNDQIFHHQSSDNSPSYVTVVPLNRIVQFNKMVKHFKENPIEYEMMSIYVNKLLSKNSETPTSANDSEDQFDEPEYYPVLIDALKLYTADSFHDGVLESFLMKIVRSLKPYKEIDITRTGIYELLLNLREITPTEDPSKWWYDAMLPGSGLSSKADMEQELYDRITPQNLSTYVDMEHDIQNDREIYNDVIYCIDSENPLEIDDGISIKRLGNKKYLVSSFIADPSSYLTPDSVISEVAFERGSTLYLPELSDMRAVTMLPKVFADEIQMGYTNKPSRVLRVSFTVDLKNGLVEPLPDNNDIGFGIAHKNH